MKYIHVLLFSLSFLFSIAQSRSYDHSISAMESSASFQACNSINDSLFIVDLFGDSMEFEFPAFGFNSDIGYDNLDDTLLIKDSLVKYLNFGNPDFVEVITALAPDMLRFPGGTQSNSYNLYGSEYIMNGGNIDSIRYYLENPYAEEVDILEYNSNRNYYFFKEASYLKNSPFMQEEVFEGELNGSLNLLKETATFRNVNGGSTYDYYVVNNKYNNNEYNFLRDFIALTDSAEFLPVYVVRMFDPLLFVHVEDTSGNEQVSPLLLKITGYPLSSDSLSCEQDSIIKRIEFEAQNGIRRQVVKYAYEYARYLSTVSSQDSLVFVEYLNTVSEADTSIWSGFRSFIDTTYSDLDTIQMRIEMGNELYSVHYRKFLPSSCDGSRTDVELYARLSSYAIESFSAIFSSAEFGVIGSHRSGICDWVSRAHHILDSLGTYDDMDAWIIHKYSKYSQDFDSTDFLSDLNEQIVNSTIEDQIAAIVGDYDERYEGKDIWMTEFNVKEPRVTDNPIHGTWYDLLAKLDLFNQYLVHTPELSNALLELDYGGLDDAFNTDTALISQMNYSMLLMHAIHSRRQGTIHIQKMSGSDFEFDYADQGLLGAIISMLRDGGYSRMSPLLYMNDDTSPSVPDSLYQSMYSKPDCYGGDSLMTYSPHGWGWKVYKQNGSDCSDVRYLFTNTTNECIHLRNVPNYDTENVDLFFYEPDTLTTLYFGIDDIEAIQNPSQSVNISPEGLCYHEGSFPSGLSDGESFELPPYSITLLTAVGPDTIYAEGHTATNGDTLTGHLRFADHLIIPDGVDLVIDGAYIEFDATKGITVEAGGLLTMENDAELTRSPCIQGFWRGIEVEGQPSLEQNPTDQGKVRLFDSRIEYANIGVTNYLRSESDSTGGILVMDGMDVMNCRQAIRMNAYDRIESSILKIDKSNFKNSHFEWTEELPPAFQLDTTKTPLVHLNEVWVKFKFCDFINSSAYVRGTKDEKEKYAALYSNESRISMIGATSEGEFSDIKGFRYGLIQDMSSCYVDRYRFSNYRSAYVNSNGSTFIRSEFNTLDSSAYSQIGYLSSDFAYKTHYGLYLDYSADFWVEENVFDMSWDSLTTPPFYNYRVGLFVKDSGTDQNMIYGNHFTGCRDAMILYDHNRNNDPASPTGLKIECNEMTDNEYGFDAYMTLDSLNAAWGIHPSQGVAPVISPQQNGTSAGNYFEGQDNYDVRNDDSLGVFTYYWRQLGDSDTPGSTSIVFQENVSDSDFNIDENTCPTNVFETRNPSLALVESEFSETEIHRNQYGALIDGGDSNALLDLIAHSEPDDENEVFLVLMEHSPYLSQNVMLALIQKEELLSLNHLTLILSANPSAAKSMAIRLALDAREETLSVDQRQAIDVGRSVISEKERLESRIAYHHRRYKGILDRERVKIIEDTSIVDKNRGLEELFGTYENLGHRYYRVEQAIRSRQAEEARVLLDSIPLDFDLIGTELQEYEDFHFCFGLLIEGTMVEESLVDELLVIAERPASRASGLAKHILKKHTDLEFEEIVVLPYLGEEHDREEGLTQEEVLVRKYSISPNPAKNRVLIEEISALNAHPLRIDILDLSGREISSQDIFEFRQQDWMDIGLLKPGVYVVRLIDTNSGESETHSIHVQ